MTFRRPPGAGIMMIYAVSGITLIFRNTDTFKQEVQKEITVEEASPKKHWAAP